MDNIKVVEVSLDDKIINVEAVVLGGEQDVAATLPNLDSIFDELTAVSQKISRVIDEVSPDKVSVEFGVGIALKSGKLSSIILNGEGNANIKVKMTWEKQPS